MRVRARCVRSRWWAITGVTTAQEEGWRGCGLNSIIGFETPFPAFRITAILLPSNFPDSENPKSVDSETLLGQPLPLSVKI